MGSRTRSAQQQGADERAAFIGTAQLRRAAGSRAQAGSVSARRVRVWSGSGRGCHAVTELVRRAAPERVPSSAVSDDRKFVGRGGTMGPTSSAARQMRRAHVVRRRPSRHIDADDVVAQVHEFHLGRPGGRRPPARARGVIVRVWYASVPPAADASTGRSRYVEAAGPPEPPAALRLGLQTRVRVRAQLDGRPGSISVVGAGWSGRLETHDGTGSGLGLDVPGLPPAGRLGPPLRDDEQAATAEAAVERSAPGRRARRRLRLVGGGRGPANPAPPARAVWSRRPHHGRRARIHRAPADGRRFRGIRAGRGRRAGPHEPQAGGSTVSMAVHAASRRRPR